MTKFITTVENKVPKSKNNQPELANALRQNLLRRKKTAKQKDQNFKRGQRDSN